jgi:hypothetical protein
VGGARERPRRHRRARRARPRGGQDDPRRRVRGCCRSCRRRCTTPHRTRRRRRRPPARVRSGRERPWAPVFREARGRGLDASLGGTRRDRLDLPHTRGRARGRALPGGRPDAAPWASHRPRRRDRVRVPRRRPGAARAVLSALRLRAGAAERRLLLPVALGRPPRATAAVGGRDARRADARAALPRPRDAPARRRRPARGAPAAAVGLLGTDVSCARSDPRKRKYDERIAAETVRTQVGEALRRLSELGFVDVLDEARLRPAPH